MINIILRCVILFYAFHFQLFSADSWHEWKNTEEKGEDAIKNYLFEFSFIPPPGDAQQKKNISRFSVKPGVTKKPKKEERKSGSLPTIPCVRPKTENFIRANSEPLIGVVLNQNAEDRFVEGAEIVRSPKRYIFTQLNFLGHFANCGFLNDQFSRCNFKEFLAAPLVRCRFTSSEFKNCTFILCDLNATFENTKFIDCFFIDADFQGCEFINCTFSNVWVKYCANSTRFTPEGGRTSIFPSDGSVKVIAPVRECSTWQKAYDAPNIDITWNELNLPPLTSEFQPLPSIPAERGAAW